MKLNFKLAENLTESTVVQKLITQMRKIQKQKGYVHMVDDRGMEVSVDMDSIDGVYAYGMDQHDNDVEIDLSSGDYQLVESKENEADGSMNDVPVKTQGSSIKFKLKTDGDVDDNDNSDSIEEIQADKDVKHKKLAKIKAKAKSKIKCTGDKTPELIPGAKIRYKCTTVNKKASRTAKKAGKKRAQSAAGKMAVKKAIATRAFRSK